MNKIGFIYYPGFGIEPGEESKQAVSVFLSSSTIGITIDHNLADIRLLQKYKNDTGKRIEGFLIISKDLRGLYLNGVKVEVDGKEIVGQVISLAGAQSEYANYVSRHGIVEQRTDPHSDFYKIGLGWIDPLKEIVVRVYLQAQMKLVELDEFYNFSLVIPCGVILAECSQKERATPVVFSGMIVVKCENLSVIDIFSPSHGDSFKPKPEIGDRESLLSSSVEFSFLKTDNKDFELRMRMNGNSKPVLILEKPLANPKSKNSGSMMLHMLPQSIRSKEIKFEILVLVSYCGRFCVEFEDNFQVLLDCIPDNCVFNVITSPWKNTVFSQSKSVTEKGRSNAFYRVSELMRGSKNVMRSNPFEVLQKSLEEPIVDGVLRRVILITDEKMEEFHMEDFSKIWKSRPEGCTLFTVSVGKSSQRLEEMAKAGMGVSVCIENCGPKSRSEIRRVVQEATKDIKVSSKVALMWKDLQGRTLDVNENGEAEAFVQSPAVVNNLIEGMPLEVSLIQKGENSLLLPKSVEICIKSPWKTETYQVQTTDGGATVEYGQIRNIEIGKMLREPSPKRRKTGSCLAKQCEFLHKDSTIVAVGEKRKSLCIYWVLPIVIKDPLEPMSMIYFCSNAFSIEREATEAKKSKLELESGASTSR